MKYRHILEWEALDAEAKRFPAPLEVPGLSIKVD